MFANFSLSESQCVIWDDENKKILDRKVTPFLMKVQLPHHFSAISS